MTMTDPVSDLLTRIRNATQSRHETVDVPLSKMKVEIARILKEEGFISNFIVMPEESHGVLRIQLRYGPGKKPVIDVITRVSRPGCRVYARKTEIPDVLGGMGISILSTSQGILTGRQAREKGLGGEVLCTIS
jgi:small subunit ribosomal protein S8